MRRLRNFFALTTFIALLGGPAGAGPDAATGWPGLRGPTYDGAARQARLFGTAPRGSLAVGWMKPLGSGYSGVTAEDGRVVTMFAAGDADVAAAFDAATGNELWRYRIADAYKGHDGSHDGPISTPLMAGGRVFGLAPRGELFALDAATGKSIWTKNIVEAHDAVMPFYGFTTSPILVEGVLVVEIGAPEGRTIAGLHPDDGRLLWTAGNDSISFHSPIAATIGDRVLVVAAGRKTFLGLEPATGRALWSYEHNGDESAMGGETIIPVPAGNGRFFLLNKNDSSVMLQVVQTAKDSFEVKELWSKNSMRGTYAIPVYHDGYIYGMTGKIVTCVDAATGETKWKSREPGDGFPTLVGNHLLMITKPGTLHVAEASPAGYSELARLDLFGEHSWSAVAYLDGHIYARSMGHLARIDLTQDASSPKGGPTWVASTRFGRFLEDVGKAADKRAAVDAFLAGQKSLPIVEENGAVHFIYRGEATDVGIVGDMIGFRREDPMTRLEGTDLFHYSTRLEPDAALNYGFIVDYGKPIADPKNPNQGSGLWGEVSWLAMPAWSAPSFLSEAETARQGRLETLDFESTAHEGAKRSAQIYLPAGYDASGDRRFPTLYVHDGKEALERGQMKNALDQL
ncbi:MAG TPA: PQQ-binding-like beta-propeller repeat protein, partial [Candidatus Polarisedimenticolia bacterium]|nr:PQQ-binding-like beta-propeller repeat protein [Candidatus Polarisedimenticolia bacterium]